MVAVHAQAQDGLPQRLRGRDLVPYACDTKPPIHHHEHWNFNISSVQVKQRSSTNGTRDVNARDEGSRRTKGSLRDFGDHQVTLPQPGEVAVVDELLCGGLQGKIEGGGQKQGREGRGGGRWKRRRE